MALLKSKPKIDPNALYAWPIRVTQAMRDYWLDRFSLEELRELGACLESLAGSDREHAAWES